jgi:lipopolysaccharide export system permease protein
VSILGNYLVRTILAYTALTLLVLLTLGSLFMFIGQQDDIGTGSYSSTQAMLFVALNLPAYVAQFMPIAALIGALLGLGNLARGSELVVMRASGVTTARFCIWLATAGLLLTVVMVCIAEYVAPPLERYGRQLKVFSKYAEFSFAGNRGTWLRDGDTFLSVAQQSARSSFGGVEVVRVGPDRHLLAVGRAEAASLGDDKQWRLEDYVETRFTNGGTEAARTPAQPLRSTLSADLLGLAVAEPESMSLRDLAAYIGHLERNHLDAQAFKVALWSRVARTAAMVFVVILALPFALGPLRSSGQGARTVIGILIGAGFVLLSQTLESTGNLFDLPAWVIGWGPTALLALLTAALLARTR